MKCTKDNSKINQLKERKKERKSGILQKAMKQMVEECVTYVSESNNQAKLHTAILGPTIAYCFQSFYPYLVAFVGVFALNFVLTIILLVFVLRL